MDVGTPCQRVELDLVVDDLGAGVDGGEVVEALDLILFGAEANSNPVPNDLGAIVDDGKGVNGGDGWCIDNALQVCLLAGECDGTELEI